LQGEDEQRVIKLSQFSRHTNPDHYVYTEHGSKNRNGGFYQLHVPNKNVQIHKNEIVGEQCLLSLLNLYISKLPQAAKEKDLFYCKPLQNYQSSECWYFQ